MHELDGAISLDPGNRDARMLLGNLLADDGQIDQAANVYLELTRRSPEFAEAYNNLGLLFLKTDRLTDARAAFERATRKRPDYAAAHYNLALVLDRQDDKA